MSPATFVMVAMRPLRRRRRLFQRPTTFYFASPVRSTAHHDRWSLSGLTRTFLNTGNACSSCWKWCLPAQPRAFRNKRQVHRRLRAPEIDDLVAGYLAGSTVYELAHQFSIHRQTVSEILRRRGISRRYRKLSPEQLDLACTLYRDGLSLTKVGKQLGRRAETVRQALMKAGVEIRSRNGWRR